MAAYPNFSDHELMSLLSVSDQRAFNEIYERYSGLLYTYAYKLTDSADDARDLLQEIFISLWDRREQLEIKTSLSSYLYSAVRFQFLKSVQKEKVRSSYAAGFLASFKEELTAADYTGEKELIAHIEEYVREMPPQMARVFTMSRFKHLSNPEIAEELNLSEKTVRNLLSESLKTLRPKVGASLFLVLLHYYR
jgi:RNA polymerase sigma-70 factor (ECF subfamily)